ncbi:hypothetical protein, partial [Plasmodium yoelii yoelii]
ECEKNEYNKYVLDIYNVNCRNITRENNISKGDQEKIQKNYILNTLEDVANIYNMQNKNDENGKLQNQNDGNGKLEKGMNGYTKSKSVKKLKGKVLTKDSISRDNFSITNEKIENKFVDNNNKNNNNNSGNVCTSNCGINNIVDGNVDNKILKYYDNINNNQVSNNLLRSNENLFNTKIEMNNPVLHIVGNVGNVGNVGSINSIGSVGSVGSASNSLIQSGNVGNVGNVGNYNSSDISQGGGGNNNNREGSNKVSPYRLNSVNLNMLNKKYNYNMNSGNGNTNVLKLIYRNDQHPNIKNGDSPLYLINGEYNKNMNRNNTSSNSTKSSSNHSTNSILSFRGVNNNEKNSNNLKNLVNKDNYGYVEPIQNSFESFRPIINPIAQGKNIKNVGNLKHSNNVSQTFKINNNENVRNVGMHMVPNGVRSGVISGGVNGVVSGGVNGGDMGIYINSKHPSMCSLDSKNNYNREMASSKNQQNNIGTDFEGNYKSAKDMMPLHDNNMSQHKLVDGKIKIMHPRDGKVMADSVRSDANNGGNGSGGSGEVNRVVNMVGKIKPNFVIPKNVNINPNNNFSEYQREIHNSKIIKMNNNISNIKNDIVNDINSYMYGNKLNIDIRNDSKTMMKDIKKNRREYLVEPYKKINQDNYHIVKNILFNRNLIHPQIVNGSYISNCNIRRNSNSSVASNLSNNSNMINYGNIFYLDNKVGFKNVLKPNSQLYKDISILNNTKNKNPNELLKKKKKKIITKYEVKYFLVNTVKAIGCVLKKWKTKKMGIYFWFHIQCIESEKDLDFYINIFNFLFEIITGKNIYYQHNNINNIINIFKEFILYDCKHIFKKIIKILNNYAKKNSKHFSIFGNLKEDLLNVNKSLLLNESEQKSFLTSSDNLIPSTSQQVQNDVNNFENQDNKKNNFLEYLFNSIKDNYYSLEKNNTGKLYLSNMFSGFSELNYNEIFNVFLKQPN